MKVLHLKKFLFVLILLCLSSQAKAQFYAVRTNVVGLATTNLNAEFSASLNRKWSVHLPVQYNPWTFAENKKFKNLTTMPGVRYWLNESYGYGYFLGLHGLVSRFNFGGLLGSKHRYDGMAYGGGLSGGYSKPIGRRLNLEFELGIGIVQTDYDKYACAVCGTKINEENKIHIIPSKIAINIVYLF
ncbi:MAG: DUF3575 domain-containing protein [Bacteroidia bacterium]|jgi:hypothetical protein|nr:DUF3575 domain-containing protein [Bacteroidia bacterium]